MTGAYRNYNYYDSHKPTAVQSQEGSSVYRRLDLPVLSCVLRPDKFSDGEHNSIRSADVPNSAGSFNESEDTYR